MHADALFTVLGTEKALIFSASNIAAVVLGVMTVWLAA
jgi:uncharacterized membrane protein YeiH